MSEPRARILDMCAALPEAAASGDQHVGFTVRGRRFAWLLEDHHGDGRLALNCKAPPGANHALALEDAARYFVPAYLGAKGWVGVYLDVDGVDWVRVEALVADAFRLTAPKRLATQVGSASPKSGGRPGDRDRLIERMDVREE